MPKARSLIYVPVLHSPADMGSLAARLSPSSDYGAHVAAYWDRIEAEVRALRRPWRGVHVYQDGLPDTNAEILARIIAEVDSPNYRLLRWLAARGAVVVGTEDPVLLQEEYQFLRASISDASARREYAARAAELLARRDRYVAIRIDTTLPTGGTGLLFMGAQHRVGEALPRDITVSTLVCSHELLAAVTDLDRHGQAEG